MSANSKTCFKCGTEKPLDEFYKHKAMADGYLGKCKSCAKSDVAANRQENIETHRAKDRARGFRGSMEYAAKYKAQSPERRAAQVAVGNAIRDGRIKKLPCFECGKPAEAHHPDYSRPLDVIWLCSVHHKEVHKMAKAA